MIIGSMDARLLKNNLTLWSFSTGFLIALRSNSPKTLINPFSLQSILVAEFENYISNCGGAVCKAPWPVSAKLTFDCDKCDCIEYLPARLALSLITETDFDELSRSADKICNPRARGGGRLMKQYLDFTSKLELIPCIDVVCLIKTNTENCMNVKMTLDRICLQQSGSRGCATMQRSPAVSQKLIQWQLVSSKRSVD